MISKYQVTDKVRSVIANDYRQLQVMSRFGISLGFGEKTINDVCRQQGVDPKTCVEVLNYVCDGGQHPPRQTDSLDVASLLSYLRKTHSYFLDYLFPVIRRNLLSSIDCSVQNEVAFVLLRFYDEYVEEVRQHMNYEEEVSFSYVDELLNGKWTDRRNPDSKRLLSAHHDVIEKKLMELKNLFVQYYPQQGTSNELNAVLYELYRAQEDLEMHCLIEDHLFAPAVHDLESRVQRGRQQQPSSLQEEEEDSDALSAREKEIVVCVARGMANKEIADKLCLSINTVTTHRRNIARKLQIHSSAGITIYAIVNKLVSLEEGMKMM